MGYQALLFCPDEKTARSVSQVLSELDFSIEPCTEPFGAVKKLMAQRFDAIVVDCDNEQNAMLLFKSARNSGANQAALAVAVVEGQAGVAKAFRIGANLVLTKPINVEQAKGTLRVARGLLRKGSEAVRPTASPGTVRTNVRPSPGAPPRGQTPAIPPARSTTPAAKPPKAPSPTAVVPSTSEARDQDPRKTQAPAGVHEASPAASAVPAKPAYPWQRAARPAAEPTAVRKAAETLNPELLKAPGKPISSAPPSSPARPTGATQSLGPAAAAPATAKEKETVKPSDITAASPAAQPARPRPQNRVATGTEVEAPTARTLVHPDVEPPSFPVGSSDWGEEDEGGNKKALVIVAAVVLLAASAAYLGWRNSGTKHAVQPSLSPAAGTLTAPEAATDSKPEDSTPVAPTESANTSEDASRTAPTATPKTSPAIKAHGKESSAAVPETPKQEPAAEPLVVKRDKSSATAPPVSAGPSEPVQPPSTVGVVGSGDTKELANISNLAVAVPKPVPQLVKISQGVSEGLILKKVAPKYPPQAIQLRLQGSVELQATISKQGNITDLKVLTGDSMLAHAAQEAVKQWKYKPFYLNGEPVDVQTMITVNFTLPN
ncbi:MAG TPA: TonB family protein [Terriglobales bacterium]|nr:TonB family protein [Terriglobales bacterium]